jgi:lysophospholipase L1-like esterase
VSGLFVALGDSFTEGVGDYNPNFPNGVRGWADRVAKQLAKQDPDFRYANLAVRSKRLHQIIADQLEPAIALRPTLVSFYAGGNDILEFKRSMSELMAEYEGAIRQLSETGARLILFTGFEVMLPPVLEPMRRRNWAFNEAVRELARRYDAVLVDHWAFERYQDRRMWDTDRLHMSALGHRYMAARVLEALGVDHTLKLQRPEAPVPAGLREILRRERDWLQEWVIPMFGRKFKGVTLGDNLPPRWPEPVLVSRGLKKLARERSAAPAG